MTNIDFIKQKKYLSTNNIACLLGFILFCIINVILTAKHETWYDEARAWELAKLINASNYQSILSNEGHPILWYLILKGFLALGFPFSYVKYFSTFIVTVSAFLLLFFTMKKPEPAWYIRLTLIFSPMFMYYYSAICRSYCIASLLIVILLLLFKERRKYTFLMCIIVSLLIQVHVLVIGFCFGICVVMVIEEILMIRYDRKLTLKRLAPFILPVCSALFYFIEFSEIFKHPFLASDGNAVGAPGLLLPFYMELNHLLGDIGIIVFLIIAFGVTVYLIIVFVMRKSLCLIPAVSVFLISNLSFAFISHYYLAATGGQFILSYFALFLIWYLYPQGKFNYFRIKLSWLLNLSIVAMTVCLWINNFELVSDDYHYLFSDANNTACFINTLPDDALIINAYFFPGESIMPYVDENRQIYYIDGESFRTVDVRYIETKDSGEETNIESMLKKFDPSKDVYLILYIQDDSADYYNRLVKKSDGCIVYVSTDRVLTFSRIRERFIIIKISREHI